MMLLPSQVRKIQAKEKTKTEIEQIEIKISNITKENQELYRRVTVGKEAQKGLENNSNKLIELIGMYLKLTLNEDEQKKLINEYLVSKEMI